MAPRAMLAALLLVAALPGSVHAAAAPSVVTGGAFASIGWHGWFGTANPNGLSTRAAFEYGTTPALGLREDVPHDPASGCCPASDVILHVSASSTSLEGGSTYFYRLVATNAAGTSYGEIKMMGTAGSRPGAQPPPAMPKGRPGLTLRSTRTHDGSRPYRYAATGAVILPASITKNVTWCSGDVVLALREGPEVVGGVIARVRPDCTFSKKVAVEEPAVLARRSGRLRLTARFAGNLLLKPKAARPRTVTYGPR